MFWISEIKLKPHSRMIMGGSSLLRTEFWTRSPNSFKIPYFTAFCLPLSAAHEVLSLYTNYSQLRVPLTGAIRVLTCEWFSRRQIRQIEPVVVDVVILIACPACSQHADQLHDVHTSARKQPHDLHHTYEINRSITGRRTHAHTSAQNYPVQDSWMEFYYCRFRA